jgi:hypothetical protein
MTTPAKDGPFLHIMEGHNRYELELAYNQFCQEPEVDCDSPSIAAYQITGPRHVTDPSDHIVLAFTYRQEIAHDEER